MLYSVEQYQISGHFKETALICSLKSRYLSIVIPMSFIDLILGRFPFNLNISSLHCNLLALRREKFVHT